MVEKYKMSNIHLPQVSAWELAVMFMQIRKKIKKKAMQVVWFYYLLQVFGFVNINQIQMYSTAKEINYIWYLYINIFH